MMSFPVKLVLGILGALCIPAILFFSFGDKHYPRPVVEVRIYNDTPANFENGLGQKKFQSEDFPYDYETVFKYVMVSNRGDLLNGTAYRRRFSREGDAIHKCSIFSESDCLVIFSNFKPDPESGLKEERERAKWLKVKKHVAAKCDVLSLSDQPCTK